MAMTSPSVPTNRVLEWAQVLRQCRTKIGASLHRVADVCGTSIDVVRSWENGEALPNHFALKQLNNFFPRLRHYSDLLPKAQPIVSKTEEPELLAAKPLKTSLFSIAQQHNFRKPDPLPSAKQPSADSAPIVPKKPEPPPEPVLSPIHQLPVPEHLREFKRALRYFRASMTSAGLARRMDVSSSTIYSWETGRNQPILDHYNKLLEIFPGLRTAPRPSDLKDWDKPDSSGSPKSYSVPHAHPQPAPAPVPPPAPEPAVSAKPAITPSAAQAKPDIGALGVAYATALSKESVIQARVDELMLQLLETEEALKAAREQTEKAHEALKKATGAP